MIGKQALECSGVRCLTVTRRLDIGVELQGDNFVNTVPPRRAPIFQIAPPTNFVASSVMQVHGLCCPVHPRHNDPEPLITTFDGSHDQ
jgi:hypothetical protein